MPSPKLQEKRLSTPQEPDMETVLYHGDCLDLLFQIPIDSVQLVVTSPPYNIGKRYEKKRTLEHYLEEQEKVIDRCFELRSRKLPKETGGILVGYFDVPRKTVYLVDALPAPPDSVEHTTAFIRGTKGLRESLNRIRERTAKVVDYVGEWHSHPIGVSVQPSYLDTDLLRQITEEMRSDGWPGVILISGDGGTCAIYVQTGEDLWRA